MNLRGLKRRTIVATAVAVCAAGLAVGLAGPAAAQPSPPPGHSWAHTRITPCLASAPPVVSGEYASATGVRCILSSRVIGSGPTHIEHEYGMSFDVFSLRPLDRGVVPPNNPHADRAPVGFLDACDRGMVSGWAKDPDWTGSVDVHLYNQNGFVKAVTAADPSAPGTGGTNQRFAVPHGQGPGAVLTVYALGRNAAGAVNGVNPALPRPNGPGTTCVVS